MKGFENIAGIEVERKKRWGRDLHLIRTGENHDRAQVVWSLLDRDKCLIIDRPGRTAMYSYETWYPTSLPYRILTTWYRRNMLIPFVSIVVLLFVLLFLVRFTEPSAITWGYAAVVIIILLVVLAVLYFWLRRVVVTEARTLFHRLLLGVLVGLAWSLAVEKPTPVTLIGAVWVFVVANAILIGTVAYDRWLFDESVNHVGGLLSRSVANDRLRQWRYIRDEMP
jgi:phosphoglycerol transferase MdoB-like AlkP superfamily enzyme